MCLQQFTIGFAGWDVPKYIRCKHHLEAHLYSVPSKDFGSSYDFLPSFDSLRIAKTAQYRLYIPGRL